MLAVFTLTIFVGAFLLFLVQPMVAKLMLPMAGGSPAAWNASMVFFQAVLLGGYVYAHLLSRLRSVRTQAGVHLVVVLAALAALPIRDPRAWEGPGDGSPVWWLLAALAACVGGPFFVLSTTGPLVQRWFSGTRHPSARDPYFLYAASNVGSLLALLSYPVLVEPLLTLSRQRAAFTVGYVVFGVLVIWCGMLAARVRLPAELGRAQRRELGRRGLALAPAEDFAPPPTWRQRGLWIALAFVPSSLSLGVTQHLSTDVAAVPLLWVLPLATYLLTFILAFSGRPGLTPAKASRLVPWAVIVVTAMLVGEALRPVWALAGLHLLGLFVVGVLCHGRLAATRPPAPRLTEFYLWVAVGGVLGGMFNSLVAPVVFNDILEYPVALVLALLLRLPGARPTAGYRVWVERGLIVLAPVASVGLYVGARAWLDAAGIVGGFLYPAMWLGPAVLLCAALASRRGAAAAAVGALLAAHALGLGRVRDTVYKERTFFGVVRVTEQGKIRKLMHGTTQHGLQDLFSEQARYTPTSYFHPQGPIGDVFKAMVPRADFDHVAVIGLGVGTLAAYGGRGGTMTFYEIDPAVVRIARDLGYFTYLGDSLAKVDVVVGDARLRLAEAPDHHYDMLIVDAFSSDAIPVHLITLEAAQLYWSKIAPGGVLAFHITNRHLDLTPVLLGIGNRMGLQIMVRDEPDFKIPEVEVKQHKSGSTWVVLCRDASELGTLAHTDQWMLGRPGTDSPVWTDDYSNILSVLFFWR